MEQIDEDSSVKQKSKKSTLHKARQPTLTNNNNNNNNQSSSNVNSAWTKPLHLNAKDAQMSYQDVGMASSLHHQHPQQINANNARITNNKFPTASKEDLAYVDDNVVTNNNINNNNTNSQRDIILNAISKKDQVDSKNKEDSAYSDEGQQQTSISNQKMEHQPYNDIGNIQSSSQKKEGNLNSTSSNSPITFPTSSADLLEKMTAKNNQQSTNTNSTNINNTNTKKQQEILYVEDDESDIDMSNSTPASTSINTNSNSNNNTNGNFETNSHDFRVPLQQKSAFGYMSGLPLDWNRSFQTFLEMQETTEEQRLEKYQKYVKDY